MGSSDGRAFVKKARPILWRRDYEAARGALLDVATKSPDDERFFALLSAVHDFERTRPSVELLRIVELAECVFIPGLPAEEERSRRWSDASA
jgi:hypothetical protein